MKNARIALLLVALVALAGCSTRLRHAAAANVTGAMLNALLCLQSDAPLTQSTIRGAAPVSRVDGIALAARHFSASCPTMQQQIVRCRSLHGKPQPPVRRVVVIRAEGFDAVNEAKSVTVEDVAL